MINYFDKILFTTLRIKRDPLGSRLSLTLSADYRIYGTKAYMLSHTNHLNFRHNHSKYTMTTFESSNICYWHKWSSIQNFSRRTLLTELPCNKIKSYKIIKPDINQQYLLFDIFTFYYSLPHFKAPNHPNSPLAPPPPFPYNKGSVEA